MRLGEMLSGLIAVGNRVIAVTVRRRQVDMTSYAATTASSGAD